MEKKYFYVDNLHEYGKRLYRKRLPEDWIFANLSEDVYCLYNEKTRKIVMSKKHPKDKPDITLLLLFVITSIWDGMNQRKEFI